MDEPLQSHDFTLPLTGLRRTQGAERDFRLEAAYAETFETGLVQLPRGRGVRVTGMLQSVGDGVLVTAVAQTTLDAQCSRCLAPFTRDEEVELLELFVYPEHEAEYVDEDVRFIADEAIDLGEAVREAVILAQPLIPLCADDCPGLCPVCGTDLNADPDHTHSDATDERWLTLTQWGKMS